MTDLTAKIAALPKWPVFPNWTSHADVSLRYPAESVRQERERIVTVTANAALARLALAREWISFYPHQAGCPWRGVLNDVTGKQPPCNCGRDQLLAALEEPK